MFIHEYLLDDSNSHKLTRSRTLSLIDIPHPVPQSSHLVYIDQKIPIF